MSRVDDSDLDAPLLENGNEEISSQEVQPMGGSAGAGVTLHGESLDLRHLFSAGGASKSSITLQQHEDPPAAVTLEEEDDQPQQQTNNTSSAAFTLSLDNQSASTRGAPSILAYMKQTIMFLPKRGRSFYYRTKYNVANFISSKTGSSNNGGLTPVDATASASASSATNNDNNNTSQSNNKKRNQLTQRSALSFTKSTPLLLKLLIPPLLITNHVLFYHAQTKPMWNLAYKTNVTISATASTLKSKAAADALNVPHHYEFKKVESNIVETFTYMDAIRKLWEGEGLGDAQTISKVAAALLVIFSGIWPHLKLLLVHLCWFFPFAHGLWLGNNDEDEEKCCPKRCKSNHSTKSRCSLCCSNGHSHQTNTLRSPFLRALSTLGKWSLADVLVVCILIAVLHLDWQVHPDAIRTGIEKELPTLLEYAHSKYPDEVKDCTQLLKYTCGSHAKVLHLPACLACQGLIQNAFHHPEWTSNQGKDILDGITLDGGGCAQLRVQGMVGTYYFCGAVIMSILLSLIVDMLDDRDRGSVEEDLLDRKRELEFILPGENDEGVGNELELRDESLGTRPPLNDALMLDDPSARNQMSAMSSSRGGASSYSRLDSNSSSGHLARRSSIPSPTTNMAVLKQALLILLSLSSLPLVCYAVTLSTMQRQVYGGGPTLLHEVLGMIWQKEYSLITLVKTTGDAGGWDTFLMVTFGLFAVVGPILRSICLILHVLLGLPTALLGDCLERPRQRTTLRMILFQATSTLRRALLPIIDALGAFGCWEVLLVALVMIQLEIPSITDTIYQDDRCQELDPNHGRTCIEVQFNALDNFLVVGVAWAVLTAASALAMDVAVDAEENSHNVPGQEEKRYEFGQAIPQRRSNLSRDRAWGSNTGNGHRNNEGDQDEYHSPLQQGEMGGRDNGLEQIVFV